MKTTLLTVLGLLIIAGAALMFNTTSAQKLSTAEIDGLIFIREEEKLARDVYETLFKTWNLQVFSNINQSEQNHTLSVKNLLSKYEITDPVINDSVGVFSNSDLQKLYNELIERGTKSLEDALVVGATIEDLDIADLQKQIALTDKEDIRIVYENLMKGSRNHLRSFVAQLKMHGAEYKPTYISQAEFNTIISSSQETGGGSPRNR